MAAAFQFGVFVSFALCLCGVDGAPQVLNDALPHIEVRGRQILVNGEVFHMKGICWNPVPKGGKHPMDLDFLGFYQSDILLMQELGVNVVRVYEPILEKEILDAFWDANIMVIQVAYNWGGDTPANIVPQYVNDMTKNHPAVLLWEVGNEWNYNMFYWDEGNQGPDSGLNYQEALQVAADAATLVKELDPSRPVATNYGEFPDEATLQALSHVDVWALNMYRGKDFGNAFETWSALSDKPMYVGEYGCDAFNNLTYSTDFDAQALCTEELTQQLVANSVKKFPSNGTTSGGIVFELADEWWKVDDLSRGGNNSEQDNGGSAPGGGPYPDGIFNEEWWGLIDIDRTSRRPAFTTYKNIAVPEDPSIDDSYPSIVLFILTFIPIVVAVIVYLCATVVEKPEIELQSPQADSGE